MVSDKKIHALKIKELFSTEEQYRIPIYQRNYAWGKGQVEQLIQDVFDFSQIKDKKTYYIGTLVVNDKLENSQIIFETIDGQQRLTTLSILLSVLKNKFKMKFDFKHLLSYESRESSNRTFEEIYRKGNDKNNPRFTSRDDYNATMKSAYEIIEAKLNKFTENMLNSFTDYLLNYVEILRVSVPDDTDLNHYFEIMNSRGEQLEKHEVLKAKMLEKLDENERIVFSKVWDACSDMSRYVQYGFTTKDRKVIFGKNWNCFQVSSFNDLETIIIVGEKNIDNKGMCLTDIINPKNEFIIEDDLEKNLSERFTSPINFQNFLLHVLRIQIMNNNDHKIEDIPLDDKRLIESFDLYLSDEYFVKEFGFNLLKLKYLLDNYIIKRDYSEDREDGKWSLKKLKEEASAQYNNSFNVEDNNEVLMLLSMFHVSNPSQIYKHWLSGALNYLYKQDVENIKAFDYFQYLESLAQKFFFRYISSNEIKYSDIIFSPNQCKFEKSISKLNQGTNVENYIFNYLDYLLWKKYKDNNKEFTFTFKSSVEHVYPQHPKDGQNELEKNILDSFGNLCLISASKNSALSNYQPKAKADHYHASGYDSIKQKLMMKKADNWWIDEINDHNKEMMEVLGLDNDVI